MKSKRNKAGYTSIPKTCKYCHVSFKASREDTLFCSSRCRKAKHTQKERIEKVKEVKRLEKKDNLLERLKGEKKDVWENLKILKDLANDLFKTFEDATADTRKDTELVYDKILFHQVEALMMIAMRCEDDILKIRLTGNDFNYQIWDILEGRAFEREDESEAYDDDETMV